MDLRTNTSSLSVSRIKDTEKAASNQDAAPASQPFGEIAEWAGLHYKKNWDGESLEGKRELVKRYLDLHRDANENFSEISLERENVKLVLEDIGEGLSGEYDANDPEDEPSARFSVYARPKEDFDAPDEDGWCAMNDASYCTSINTNLPPSTLHALAELLLEQVFQKASRGESIKHLGQQLSHVSEEWLLTGVPEQIARDAR